MYEYDVITIGAGAAGLNAMKDLAETEAANSRRKDCYHRMPPEMLREELARYKINCWQNNTILKEHTVIIKGAYSYSIKGAYSYSTLASGQASKILSTPVNDTIFLQVRK